MKRFVAILLTVLVFVCSCGSGQREYMEGPKDFTGEIGKLAPIPETTRIREIADGFQKYMLEFNFNAGIAGQVNPLNKEETAYMIENRFEAGTPQINPQAVIPGKAEIVFSNGSIGIFDRTTSRFSSFELSLDLVPPPDLASDNKRPLTKEIVERIARLWFDRIGIDVSGYQTNPFEVMEPTVIVFQETLKDEPVRSPNYVRAVINRWGMVASFDVNIGPTPTISTRPTFDEQGIMEKFKAFMAVPKDFNFNVTPVQVIRRVMKEEGEMLKFTDSLAWFLDASTLVFEQKNKIMTLDAHTGMPVQ